MIVLGAEKGNGPAGAPTPRDYGMNFEHMPELHWSLGYPFALLLMVLVSLSLYAVFKRRGWL
jgi:lipopolysaccharide export LptBFGC system permease protein LptF